jgi:L-ascorbate metabolism protein UlaG (beta-lactamase superfamily)/ketosteroid isomerase-like protein
MKYKIMGLFLAAVGVFAADPRGPASRPAADETPAIERSIRDCIGWAKTKDFKLLYGVIANDADFLEVHPDGAVVRGIDEFRKAESFWGHPDFKAIRYEIRDLKIKLSRSGDVAWFFCLLDDINEWKGRPASWENTRWTGVLEKRDGRWVMAQQHFSSAAKEPAKARENTVTFVGISGFLIEVDGKKVLIDGLSNYTPPAVEQRLLAGEAPFDGLDLVMATHSHGDHFNAAAVGRCLRRHPKAAFVAPKDAADLVSGFPDRVFPLQAVEGKRTPLEVNGIRIQAMPLSHGIPPAGIPGIVNLGYLVTVGSVTFFHSGDIDPSELKPELLRALGLPDERIDFAFVPGFFLAMPEPPPFVTKGIRPRVFIAAHLPSAGQEPLDRAAILHNFPTAVVFKSEMDSWTIK